MPRRTRLALVHRQKPALPARHHSPTHTPAPRRRKRLARIAALLAGLAILVGGLAACWTWFLLEGSLPQLDGVIVAPGLSAPVTIERDEQGIPTLKAANRLDLAFATGFVHGQDRFFQMDLLRRHSAGELADLVGPDLIHEDLRMRLHRFRFRAALAFTELSGRDKDIVRAYVRGVEAGRKSLHRSPWEYLLLGVPPVPWREEDTMLVAFGMYDMLQRGPIEHERVQALIDDLLPPALAAFLSPPGSVWDAPLQGGALPTRPIPDEKTFDLRKRPDGWLPPRWVRLQPEEEPVLPGSNNWAVSGKRTVHGGAIVANDMHLGLFVPNLWYRAAFHWLSPTTPMSPEPKQEHKVFGITLPGAPAMIVGSNTRIAWGFTNTEGDFADLVLLEPVAGKPDHYQTPDGPRQIQAIYERIKVKGEQDIRMRIEETIWGPVLDRDHRDRRRVLRWVAHDPDAVNLELLRLETATSLPEALTIAPRVGSPAQNIVIADSRGNIAWTIMGRIPKRIGFDGRRPTSWADGKRRWAGWLPASDYPRIINPPDGRLWTANNRVVDEPYLSRLGKGTYDLGARAQQIRDGLGGNKKLRETDMLAIQLDDRGIFLARWQQLLLDVLAGPVIADHPHRQAIRRQVVAWGARAAPESIGFRIVRRFRIHVRNIVLRSLTAPCARVDGNFSLQYIDANVEDSIWQLVTQKPEHFLPMRYASWDDLLLAAVDRVEREIRGKRAAFMPALRAFTQGADTRSRLRHPFSPGLGPLSDWLSLDMPQLELPGDARAMPRIQAPRDGPAQRMAVSPGREEEGYFHMPTGQSGHPLSPHYRDSHDDWAKGRPSPFLPGPAKHVLELRP